MKTKPSFRTPQNPETQNRFAELRAQIQCSQDKSAHHCIAPFTGESFATVPLCDTNDVSEATERARLAQKAWAQTSFEHRQKIILRFHDEILKRQDELIDLIQLETGKARRHAAEEILDVAIAARHYALIAKKTLRDKRRRGAIPLLTQTWEVRHPWGVVGLITPWNYPFSLALGCSMPALMAGNAVLLKPDWQTSYSALWALDLLTELGLPKDLLTIVTGEGGVVGPALIDHVDYLSFTGSSQTGRVVAAQAAQRLIGASLELGGKNAMLILGDADLKAAVEGAIRGCFTNAGQLCISMERLFVEESIYEKFTEAFKKRINSMKLQNDYSWESEMGSLTSEMQLQKVREHIEDAVASGAEILAGGHARPDLGPFFHEPTLLSGLSKDAISYCEETFGPVVSIQSFSDIDEVIEKLNTSSYGLNGSVYTTNIRRGRELAARVQSGSMNINEAYAATWASIDAPMGGFKQSGLGRRHGDEGLKKFTEAQTIAVQRIFPIAPPRRGAGAFFLWAGRVLRLLRHLPGLR